MYSSEYVNELLKEIDLVKMQKKELLKGGEILKNKYDELKKELEREKKISWELLEELNKERIENTKLKVMLEEDNNKLFKETERADNLSDHVQKLQNEIKKLKHH